MKDIRAEIEIDASADRVWHVLTDFESYSEWNPAIERASGAAHHGARLTMFIRPFGTFGLTIRPIVLRVVPERELRWLGRLWVPGLFDGDHTFLIEPRGPDRVLLVQLERLKGLLVPILGPAVHARSRKTFEAMNRAIKARAEQDAS